MLSLPEPKTMEDYVNKALALSYICPFTSSTAASLFCLSVCREKGLGTQTLHCLKTVAFKYRYALSLFALAFDQVQGVQVQ